jgi:protein O-mannosyl-transferase
MQLPSHINSRFPGNQIFISFIAISERKLSMKKNLKPVKQQPTVKVPEPVVAKQKNKLIELFDRKTKRIVVGIIIALAFIVYGNSIMHDYAFDDMIVVNGNRYTKQGLKGIWPILTTNYMEGMYGTQMAMYTGGRYRPLSMVTFAIEYQFFGEYAPPTHFGNVVLYAITCVLIFVILAKMFAKYVTEKTRWYLSIPFLATVLYLVHPLHTEAIANVKGRDEIMALLGSLFALYFTWKYFETKNIKHLVYSGITMFLGLMSKENAVTFLAIIPLSIYFFRDEKLKKIAFSTIPIILATLLFFKIRASVIGNPTMVVPDNLMTDPFLEATVGQRYATTFYTLLLYIKLLFFPHPLTFDYYPYHIPLIGWGDIRAIAPLLIYIGLAAFSVWGLKTKNRFAYGVIFYLATLSIVSNVFFKIGVFMSERFLYFASLGFTIIIAILLSEKLPEWLEKRKLMSTEKAWLPSLIIAIVATGLLSFKTIDRNKAWNDNLSLFLTDVKTSGNSLKSTAAAGEKLVHKAHSTKDEKEKKEALRLAIQYFTKTVEVYPGYTNVLNYLAQCHFEYNHDYEKAIYYYKRALQTSPANKEYYDNIELMLKYLDPQMKMQDYRIKLYEELVQAVPEAYEVNYTLGSYYGAFRNDLPKAVKYLEKALKINNMKPEVIADLGIAYIQSGNMPKAIELTEAAIKRNVITVQLLQNLAQMYNQSGNKAKAQEYAIKAQNFKANTEKK